MRSNSAAQWYAEMCNPRNKYECTHCAQERKRRHRVLWGELLATRASLKNYDLCAHLHDALRSERFKEALYIQMTNETVGNYAFHKARLFAKQTSQQLLWVQAEDYLDDPHFANLTQEEKKERKSKWFNSKFHLRRTGCIPTLLPLCYDLPLRVMHGNYGGQSAELKAHGVYNQARCRLRGWELHEIDAVRLIDSPESEVILLHLPRRLFVEMEDKRFPRWKQLPNNWVPLPVSTITWSLDPNPENKIPISRRGFGVIPDFSTTIHSATGRTLTASVPSLDGITDLPNGQRAMRGYIAVSRAEDAEGLVIAEPFAPTLFKQGPAPFPTLLMEVLEGRVKSTELEEKCQRAAKKEKPNRLIDQTYTCGTCERSLPWNYFFNKKEVDDVAQNIVEHIIMEGVCAKCLQCRGFEGFDKLCPLCENMKPQPFKKHPIDNTECCADCARSALKLIEGKWLCTGIGCMGTEKKGTWKLTSCWSKAHQKRLMVKGGIRPDRHCMECTHPRCLQTNCRTCTTCRSSSCNNIQCVDEPKSLSGTQIKKLKGNVKNFICERCEGVACQACGQSMTKGQRKKRRGKTTTRTWTCPACQS